ncbi:MAG: 16S rRNA processing protein RimM [Clostridia bacterium]|nr:16S rRNA processing protein RimM [Clostridia bacterium]
MAEKKEFLEVGKIINTHGVRGEVKIDPWCDSPEDFCTLSRVYLADKTEFSVSHPRIINGKFILCSLSGIKTVEDAVKYKNKVIYVKREDLDIPEDAVLICDILGLPVIDKNTGKVYGKLTDVLQYTCQEVYEVTCENGEKVLIPNVPAFIAERDTENGIFITPIDGFFE